MNHQSKACRSLLLAIFVFAVAVSPVMAGADGPVLTVTQVSRINVDVDNQPLNVLLRVMAEKRLFNMKGGATGNESLTLHSANLTLPEMLSKILRGYNYVVIDQGKSQPPVLTVLGRVQNSAAAHAAEPARPAAPDEARSYVPPEPASELPAASATSQPGAPSRKPVANQPQAPLEARPPGEAGRPTGQTPPAVQPDQAAGLSGQPGSETQRQTGQTAQAEAPPAESPGIHF
jgi:hypothetical protein